MGNKVTKKVIGNIGDDNWEMSKRNMNRTSLFPSVFTLETDNFKRIEINRNAVCV
jgi:hypothetical protein